MQSDGGRRGGNASFIGLNDKVEGDKGEQKRVRGRDDYQRKTPLSFALLGNTIVEFTIRTSQLCSGSE